MLLENNRISHILWTTHWLSYWFASKVEHNCNLYKYRLIKKPQICTWIQSWCEKSWKRNLQHLLCGSRTLINGSVSLFSLSSGLHTSTKQLRFNMIYLISTFIDFFLFVKVQLHYLHTFQFPSAVGQEGKSQHVFNNLLIYWAKASSTSGIYHTHL